MRALITSVLLVTACTGSATTDDAAVPLPAVTGLAAIPGDVRIVAGFELEPFRRSEDVAWLVERLAVAVPALPSQCVGQQLQAVVIGLGEVNQVSLAATGRWSELGLSRCLGAVRAEAPQRAGYRVNNLASEPVWFAMGAPAAAQPGTLAALAAADRTEKFAAGTVVVADSQQRLLRALGAGRKASDDSMVQRLRGEVAAGSSAWAVVLPKAPMLAGLAELAGIELQGAYAAVQLGDGLRLEFGVFAAGDEQAVAFAEFVRGQWQHLVIIAQNWGLGPYLARVEISATGPLVVVTTGLTAEDLREMRSRIDSAPRPAQDAPSQ